MNFQITEINQIKKHNEFSDTYMCNLHVCAKFITKDEIKEKKYCSEHCKNECFKKQKHYFEQYVCFVRNPEALYIERVKDGDITYIKPPAMAARYATISNFVQRWMKITTKRSYSKIGFFPDVSKCPKDEYNTFDCMGALKTYVKVDKEQRKKLLKPILQHMDDSFETKEVVDYIIKQFAHAIKFPMDKKLNGVSIIIQGSQGSGKSFTIDEMLVPLMGDRYYYYTCKPSDISSEHSEAMPNKLVLTLDEVSAKSSYDISELLKSFITQTTLQVNPKGIRPYQVHNYCRLWFTTNSKNPLRIELDDRRYFATKFQNTHINDITYFRELSAYMKKPEVLSAWYDYLMDIDVETYDFKKNRPESSIYTEMVEASVSHIMKFVAELLNHEGKSEETFTSNANKIFTRYKQWKETTNHKDEHNTTSFGRELTNIAGVTKKRGSDSIQYSIDFKAIKEYFAGKKLFGFGSDTVVEISENDKLHEIIKRQQEELSELRKLSSQPIIDITEDYEDFDHITINIFKKDKNEEKPKKIKHKKSKPKEEIDLITTELLG
tara:strand:- start:21 stop:1667 length:1647 start_codon:yes stop_codon:yes gene_type:complete